MSKSKVEITMNRKNGNNIKNGNSNGKGQKNQKPKETKAILPKPKVQKPKTPAGHIRYIDGNVYLLQSVSVKTNLFCKACRKDNARLIGYIIVGCKIYYVARCPWHPEDIQFMEENLFREKYPDVLPEKKLSSSSSRNPNWPVQRSYCRECKATTAEIIGEVETEYGPKWVVRCTECGVIWREGKDLFAQKYIGTDEVPPMYRQTTPKPASYWKDKNFYHEIEELKAVKISPKESSKKAEVSSFNEKNKTEVVQKSSNCATVEKNKTEVAQKISDCATVPSSQKKEEHNEMILQVHGTEIKVPYGMNATIEIIDGKPVISFN